MLVTNIPINKTFKGIEMTLMCGNTPNSFRKYARENGLKYRTVFCLAKTLRGKTDLHGKPYKASEWVYMEKPTPSEPPTKTTIIE